MALIRLTAQEIGDFQNVMRRIAVGVPPSNCSIATGVANAYTRWCILSGIADADSNRVGEFDEAFFPPALDLLYDHAVTIFLAGICPQLSSLELRQLEQAQAWASGAREGGFNFTAASFTLGVVGIGLSAYLLWKGKR